MSIFIYKVNFFSKIIEKKQLTIVLKYLKKTKKN